MNRGHIWPKVRTSWVQSPLQPIIACPPVYAAMRFNGSFWRPEPDNPLRFIEVAEFDLKSHRYIYDCTTSEAIWRWVEDCDGSPVNIEFAQKGWEFDHDTNFRLTVTDTFGGHSFTQMGDPFLDDPNWSSSEFQPPKIIQHQTPLFWCLFFNVTYIRAVTWSELYALGIHPVDTEPAVWVDDPSGP